MFIYNKTNMYQCNRCYKKFDYKYYYNQHINRKYKCKEIELKKCNICGDKFMTSKELSDHVETCGLLRDQFLKLKEDQKKTVKEIKKFKHKYKKKIKKLEKEIELIKNTPQKPTTDN